MLRNKETLYEQSLYRILPDYIKKSVLDVRNRYKKWEYGYNEEFDIVVISKTGQIGEIYEIENLKIALPLEPNKKEIVKRSDKDVLQWWEVHEKPEALLRIKSVAEFKSRSQVFKSKYYDYIEKQFDYRENGMWFMNNGIPTYITGSNYMYLTWSKIDIGLPDFREANRIFWLFWEACVADSRSYGMAYAKIRRSGFSFMGASELVEQATINRDSRYGILSKTGTDAKMLFTEKVVNISIGYPFFFRPIQDGMDRPKTELAYRVPASKLTRKKLEADVQEEDIDGLDSSIDWRNTADNSYDGAKLKRLLHDESGKWESPNNILNNWKVTKTCLRLGSRIIGKCMMGSTANALKKGGSGYKKLFADSDVTDRNRNGQTKSGLYSLFIPMEWNTEGFIDRYGWPVFNTPEEPVMGVDGQLIKLGVIEHWENEAEGLKDDSSALNEFYRQFPRTIKHVFRDESKNSLFDLGRIYDQIDYNEEYNRKGVLTRGNFQWKDGIKDSTVIFMPAKNGRFLLSWVPALHLQNKYYIKDGFKYPGNEHIGAFGCDSYDISGTVDGRGSKGSLHGLTKFSMENVPPNLFFLEYIARPATAEIFFEDVLMAIVFYGMPILAENNKPRLLYYLKRRGYRKYSMNRPDKALNKLSKTEKEIGGIPNSSEDIIQSHAAAIESYISKHVGYVDGEMGSMYFQRTLEDWSSFDISDRKKYDASISSGLAIMACNRHLYNPVTERTTKKISFGFKKYDNTGSVSKIIN